jgi:hypothetical protein
MAGPGFGTNTGQDFTCQANTDLSLDQFLFVQIASTGYLQVATSGVRAIGVIQDAPLGTTAQPVASQVRMLGPTKIYAGGTFNPGDLLTSNSSGQAVKYTGATVFTGTPYTVSGSQVLGVALEGGVSGSVTAMLFNPSGLCAAGD